MKHRSTFTFDPFCLDDVSGILWRGPTALPLTPKAFAVLRFLVSRAGELVSKDVLLEAVWPDTFVGDGVLKTCIREVRKALDDDPQEPRYIETAHRRGYRFVAPVQEKEASSDRLHHDAGEPVAAGAADDLAAGTHRVGSAVAHERPPGPVALPPAPDADGHPGHLPAIPPVRYARSGDVNIAYQVLGDGPIDLVFVMGWVSHIEYFWREPSFARFLKRLASFSRLILFDKRGTGLSDRVTALPTLEQRMDDVRAILDAVGSTKAALLGVSEGGPMCALFGATYPDKTEALVMIGTYAKRIWEPDYPWAPTREAREAFIDEIRQEWGGPVGIGVRAPSLAHDAAFREWWSSYLRMGASPGAAVALTVMNAEIDVRAVLPTIMVPTLVLHRTGDKCLLVDEGRYVASLVPNAQFVELPGDDHLPFVGDQEALLDEIEQFLTGVTYSRELDRWLATVLATRIASGGPLTDAAYAERRDRFVAHLLKEADWFRGRQPLVTHEGVVIAFDGPARAVRCACALGLAAARFDLTLQAGLHTGECVGVGSEMRGPAVDVASRIAARAGAGEVLASRAVLDLVAGSGIQAQDEGVHNLAGNAGEWQLFKIARSRPA
jgi:pimeloyl-ACP methyl ester carboxylesterase/DNA-binding winged helix-turn-helix (wHTH) protein